MRLIFISFFARIFSILGWNVGEKLPRKFFNLALYFFGYRAIFLPVWKGEKLRKVCNQYCPRQGLILQCAKDRRKSGTPREISAHGKRAFLLHFLLAVEVSYSRRKAIFVS